MNSENSRFYVGFVLGFLVAAFTIFIIGGVIDAQENRDSEIVRIEYKNKNGEVSREIVENMVKSQFPSNKWQNANCSCSKNRVRIQLSNP